jgi:4-hydroxythreonine-4-phosphate dehydrogenase
VFGMHEDRVRLALTIGDPGGIGPEIVARLYQQRKLSAADIVLIGSAYAFTAALDPSIGNAITIVRDPGAAPVDAPPSYPFIIDTGGDSRRLVREPNPDGGRVSGRAIELAVSMAKAAAVDGIVTGPISKEALHLAGYPYRGHTEMLADLLEAPDCQMMMVAGDLRIAMLTRDIPLADVPRAVNAERLRRAVTGVAGALTSLWGIRAPRIAVASLNPHAGDGGLLGREEGEVIAPALEGLRRSGIDVVGPLPADTLFLDWRERGYDAFIATYHDQGMIPFKMVAFDAGVNMTIGLPVVRTSVCHGTAFDIAGSGTCSSASMEAAVSLAVQCCLKKKAAGV